VNINISHADFMTAVNSSRSLDVATSDELLTLQAFFLFQFFKLAA
jgi:hypothetical protein